MQWHKKSALIFSFFVEWKQEASEKELKTPTHKNGRLCRKSAARDSAQ
jgi:hypothetical protein